MENKKEKDRGLSQDRQRVAGGQEWELDYMTKKFNVSADMVKQAVEAVGNSRDKVEEYLSSKN